MSKKLPGLLAIVAALAISTGPVAAAPMGGAGHFVVGRGWRLASDDGTPRVEFKVGAQISGDKASGTYEYANTSGGRLSGTITCGSVDAGVAVIGGHITGGNILVGADFYVFFVDGGTPTFGSLGPDTVSFTQIPEAGDPVADDFPADFPAQCPAARGQTFQTQQLLTVLGDFAVR